MENLLQVSIIQNQILSVAASDLFNIADSLRNTGNKELSQRLCVDAKAITHASQAYDKAIGMAISERVKQAFESSDNMFRACLAGAAMTATGKKRSALKGLVKHGKL